MDETGDLENTGFLLQKLQELKNWQKLQEDQLMKEQQFQLDQLLRENKQVIDNTIEAVDIGDNNVDEDEDDDDTTIDQDLSSLHSEVIQSLPSWASRSSSSMRDHPEPDVDDTPIVPKFKSFEEMLEEKLVLDQDQPKTPDLEFAATPKSGSNSPKPFLRRGSGLARYGGVGGPKNLTPNLRRSKSHVVKKLSDNINTDDKQPRLKTSTSCPNVGNQPKKPVARKSTLKLKPKNNSESNQQMIKNKQKVEKLGAKEEGEESAQTIGAQADEGISDSVELSFMGKLEKADKKDTEDLRVFESLEQAALDSSFCSESSTVKKLIDNVSMPSPITKRTESQTSTPKIDKNQVKVKPSVRKRATVAEDIDFDVSGTGNDILMKDIKNFLESKGAVIHDKHPEEDDEDEDTVTEDHNRQDNNGGIRMESGPQQILLNGRDHDDHVDENAFFENGRGQNRGCSWSSDEDEDVNEQLRKRSASSRKNVHFRDEAMSFSPPRIPKDSPSYLIWSIFSKEREERAKKHKNKKNGQRTKSADRSPMSNLQNKQQLDYETTLLNAKLAELQNEIDRYQKENAALSSGRRKLQHDRKQLAKDVQEFEMQKEVKKKKMDEEKKRIRREKTMLEKASRDRKANFDQKAHEEIEELQAKVQKLLEELQRKEAKWGPTIAKLQEQVKFFEKENQLLHEDNHKLKLKTVSSKISTHLVDPSSRKITNSNNVNNNPTVNAAPGNIPSDSSTPDSGCHLNNKKNSLQLNRVDFVLDPNPPPPMSFSPAESLDSDMTLVSSSIATRADSENPSSKAPIHPTISIVDVKKNENKGTTEKTYSDGSVEIVYNNGNRKEISSDGNTKVIYYNSDVKETLSSGLVKYFYSQTQTWHLTYPDGKEVLQFNNGQEEIRYPNGTLQISFADGSVKRIDTDGTENINFPDGTKVIVKANGERTLLLPSGQKEIHTSTFKKREYPDGTVKTLYDDGRMETRFASGRIRIKDKDGNLVHDSNSNHSDGSMTIQSCI